MNSTTLYVLKWWLNKRLQYNKSLSTTGLAGFVTQAALQTFKNNDQTIAFEIPASGIAFIIFLILANIAFTAGSISDLLFNHKNSQSFRERLFLIGHWFAIAVLIFFIITFLYLI